MVSRTGDDFTINLQLSGVGTSTIYKLQSGKTTSVISNLASIEKDRFSYNLRNGLDELKFESSEEHPLTLKVTNVDCGPEKNCIVWGHPLKNKGKLKTLGAYIGYFNTDTDNLLIKETDVQPSENVIYLAFYGSVLFRAIIKGKTKFGLNVLFIDYGNVSSVSFVFQLPNYPSILSSLAPQAIPILIAKKPHKCRQFTDESLKAISLVEGHVLDCIIDNISDIEAAFTGTTSVIVTSAKFNISDVLKDEKKKITCSII